MAISHRSGNQPAAVRVGSVSSAQQVFPSDVLAGSTIAVCVVWGNFSGLPSMTVSDNLNGSYTAGETLTMLGGLAAIRTFYRVSSAAGPCTVTATAGASGSIISISASEFTPNVSEAAFDSADSGNEVGVDNTPSMTHTTVAATTLVYAGISHGDFDSTSATPGAGWAEIVDAMNWTGGTLLPINTQWQRFTTSGAKTVTWTTNVAISGEVESIMSSVAFVEDAPAGRTTKNTRTYPLGMNLGMRRGVSG